MVPKSPDNRASASDVAQDALLGAAGPAAPGAHHIALASSRLMDFAHAHTWAINSTCQWLSLNSPSVASPMPTLDVVTDSISKTRRPLPTSVAAVRRGPVQKLGSDPNLGEPDPGPVQSSGWGLNRTQSPVPVRRWAKNGEPGPNPVRTRTYTSHPHLPVRTQYSSLAPRTSHIQLRPLFVVATFSHSCRHHDPSPTAEDTCIIQALLAGSTNARHHIRLSNITHILLSTLPHDDFLGTVSSHTKRLLWRSNTTC